MLLIDALYINNGGGKVLLDYLIKELNKTSIDVFYLFDSRLKDSNGLISQKRKVYLHASLVNRFMFYWHNQNKFDKVFCFASLPPNIRLKAKVFTYFQQSIYLKIPMEFDFKERVKFFMKTIVLNGFRNNTDYWVVQSNIIKGKLQEKYNISDRKILIIPFYPPVIKDINPKHRREKHTYLYVSTAEPHKNHIKLINAFCEFYDEFKKGKLVLTVSEQFVEVFSLINAKIKLGYPITNVGFIKKEELQKIYLSSEYLIFPSITESFGLGIIEAIESGCKVIGANLPYTFVICKPSIVFEPQNKRSILKAFEKSLESNIQPTKQLVFNEINKMLDLLK